METKTEKKPSYEEQVRSLKPVFYSKDCSEMIWFLVPDERLAELRAERLAQLEEQ